MLKRTEQTPFVALISYNYKYIWAKIIMHKHFWFSGENNCVFFHDVWTSTVYGMNGFVDIRLLHLEAQTHKCSPDAPKYL